MKKIAIPGYTCYKVVDSYGIELFDEVVQVDVIKFTIPIGHDKRQMWGVLYNGGFNSTLIELAEISGNISHLGQTKGSAYRQLDLLENNYNAMNIAKHELHRKCNKNGCPYDSMQMAKRVSAVNSAIDFFESRGICAGRKLDYNPIKNIIKIAR